MAGTRLLIQFLAVVQLLCLTLWAFYHGLCRNDDVLCTKFWEWIDPPTPPCIPLPSSVPKPIIQISPEDDTIISKSSLLSSQFAWKSNPLVDPACQTQNIPTTTDHYHHPLWLCHRRHHHQKDVIKPSSSIVIRDSNMLVNYDTEKDLESILFPEMQPPHILQLQLFLEEPTSSFSSSTNSAAEWMSTVNKWITEQAKLITPNNNGVITNKEYWPCLSNVQINVQFVSASMTSDWSTTTTTTKRIIIPNDDQDEEISSTSNDNDDNNNNNQEPAVVLSKPSLHQVQSLLSKLSDDISGGISSSSVNNMKLVLYIPSSALPEETYAWTISSSSSGKAAAAASNNNNNEKNRLVVPSSPESLENYLSTVATHWLSSVLMGIPDVMNTDIDTDGTFPTWYTEQYHLYLIQFYSKQLLQQTKYLPCPATTTTSTTTIDDPLKVIHDLLNQQKTTSLEREFPVEHYAAIFAPLLFPLLVPLLVGLLREFKRYKEKKKKSSSLVSSSS